jgi:hypothetical protein
MEGLVRPDPLLMDLNILRPKMPSNEKQVPVPEVAPPSSDVDNIRDLDNAYTFIQTTNHGNLDTKVLI